MQNIRLSIILPAFNEAKKISNDIENAISYLSKNSINGEIIIIDDGSTDDTETQVRKISSGYPNVRLIKNYRNKGKGAAIRLGISHSNGEYVMFADAGGCIPYENANKGIEYIESGQCEMAHASRALENSHIIRRQPYFRRLGAKTFSWILGIFFNFPSNITDTQCGFKIYKGDIARELFKESFIDGFMFDIEIIKLAIKKGCRIKEFAVNWSNDPDTRFKPIRGSVRNLIELLKIRLTFSPDTHRRNPQR